MYKNLKLSIDLDLSLLRSCRLGLWMINNKCSVAKVRCWCDIIIIGFASPTIKYNISWKYVYRAL